MEAYLEDINTFITSIRTSDREQRLEALCQVAALSPLPMELMPFLGSMLADPDRVIRFYAACALESQGPNARQAVPLLLNLLQDDSLGKQVYQPIRTLIAIGVPSQAVLHALIPLIAHQEPVVRYYAVRAIGRLGRGFEEAQPALELALQSTEMALVREAQVAITYITS